MDTIKDYFNNLIVHRPAYSHIICTGIDNHILKEEYSMSTRIIVAITDHKVTLDLVGGEE